MKTSTSMMAASATLFAGLMHLYLAPDVNIGMQRCGFEAFGPGAAEHAAPAPPKAPLLPMSEDEQHHVLSHFRRSAPEGNASSMDSVWRHRLYAPMHIHHPALSAYHRRIQEAFPEHTIAFDVVFAAAELEVPWHCDFDSLGPFEVSPGSIAREEFITVHANLQKPESGGTLRTIDSLLVAAMHFVSNRLTGSFGRLAAATEAWVTAVGSVSHDGRLGVGHAFNNLMAHSVTAGSGRVSYVVRLVKRDVMMRRERVAAMAEGSGASKGSRRLTEFANLLPLMPREQMRVGEFPWDRVARLLS